MRDEEVNGQIIGGDYGQCWLTYDGRKQGPTLYARSAVTAREALAAEHRRIKDECGAAYADIYPAPLWAHNFRGIE
jgi:hypothetical protein